MKRGTKFFTVATTVVVLLIVIGLTVMSTGMLGLIFDPEPEIDSYYLMRWVPLG
ncbi:hypothetical protein [Glutamicibacter sp.]|uniref:hypothetical protein n=1 Tax=Glutamicibacter sp. TaxID=1931995 RepID=UPI0028BDBB06|nr:hypothetical protein [Glutamicibacter sp.]